ncbi:MAG: hypothetical protein RL163_2407 [Pseudomonadota bacterium]|jgi:hypothetical protein
MTDVVGASQRFLHDMSQANTSKSVTQTTLDRCFKYVSSETPPLRVTFDRLRAQLAQDAEQRSRPVARIYSGLRAVKA